MNAWDIFLLCTAAFCTLGVYSFLVKPNPVHKFLEHIFMGVAGAWAIVQLVTQTLYPRWWLPLRDGWQAVADQGAVAFPLQAHQAADANGWSLVWMALALGVGTLWYGVMFPRLVWLARLVIGLFIGASAGLAFPERLGANYPQLIGSLKPLVVLGEAGVQWAATLKHWVWFVCLVTVMVYFFFSFEHRRAPVRLTAGAGRWLMMIAFGAFFGNTLMGRLSLWIERLTFLLHGFARTLLREWFG